MSPQTTGIITTELNGLNQKADRVKSGEWTRTTTMKEGSINPNLQEIGKNVYFFSALKSKKQ